MIEAKHKFHVVTKNYIKILDANKIYKNKLYHISKFYKFCNKIVMLCTFIIIVNCKDKTYNNKEVILLNEICDSINLKKEEDKLRFNSLFFKFRLEVLHSKYIDFSNFNEIINKYTKNDFVYLNMYTIVKLRLKSAFFSMKNSIFLLKSIMVEFLNDLKDNKKESCYECNSFFVLKVENKKIMISEYLDYKYIFSNSENLSKDSNLSLQTFDFIFFIGDISIQLSIDQILMEFTKENLNELLDFSKVYCIFILEGNGNILNEQDYKDLNEITRENQIALTVDQNSINSEKIQFIMDNYDNSDKYSRFFTIKKSKSGYINNYKLYIVRKEHLCEQKIKNETNAFEDYSLEIDFDKRPGLDFLKDFQDIRIIELSTNHAEKTDTLFIGIFSKIIEYEKEDFLYETCYVIFKDVRFYLDIENYEENDLLFKKYLDNYAKDKNFLTWILNKKTLELSTQNTHKQLIDFEKNLSFLKTVNEIIEFFPKFDYCMHLDLDDLFFDYTFRHFTYKKTMILKKNFFNNDKNVNEVFQKILHDISDKVHKRLNIYTFKFMENKSVTGSNFIKKKISFIDKFPFIKDHDLFSQEFIYYKDIENFKYNSKKNFRITKNKGLIIVQKLKDDKYEIKIIRSISGNVFKTDIGKNKFSREFRKRLENISDVSLLNKRCKICVQESQEIVNLKQILYVSWLNFVKKCQKTVSDLRFTNDIKFFNSIITNNKKNKREKIESCEINGHILSRYKKNKSFMKNLSHKLFISKKNKITDKNKIEIELIKEYKRSIKKFLTTKKKYKCFFYVSFCTEFFGKKQNEYLMTS